MSGAGIGSAVGTGAGLLLAPETGGLSLAIPAAMGALGGGLGSAVTGGGNPMSAALMGGLSGLLGGALGGGQDLAGIGGDAGSAATDAGGAALPATASDAPPTDTAAMVMGNNGDSAPAADSPNWLQRNILPQSLGGTPSAPAAPVNNTSGLSPVGNAAAKSSGGLSQYLLPAGLGLAGLNALGVFGSQGSNPTNTAPMTAAQSQFNSALPTYNFNSTKTPYTGNWYTYGQSPQAPMVQNTVTPMARGGMVHGYASGGQVSADQPPPHKPSQMPPVRNLSLQELAATLPMKQFVGQSSPLMTPPSLNGSRAMVPQQRGNDTIEPDFAHGGRVRALAMGGAPMQAPMGTMPSPVPPQGGMGMPPQGMLPRPAGMPPAAAPSQQKPNPAANAAAFQKGHQLGQMLRAHIQNNGKTPDGMVNGAGKGQDDAIPAKLSANEYVIPADTVSQLGDGSSNAGAKQLDQMVTHIRAHKTSHGSKFPPRAKSPLQYIGKR